MCRVLRVARSGWYTWCQRWTRISPRQQFRQHCDSVVLAAFTRSKQRYGAPRLTDELRIQGYHFNVKTVAASLRRQGLRAKASRKFSPVSYRAHGLPVSENLLEQDFYASAPNQKWAGDITYLRTDEGLRLGNGKYCTLRLFFVLANINCSQRTILPFCLLLIVSPYIFSCQIYVLPAQRRQV